VIERGFDQEATRVAAVHAGHVAFDLPIVSDVHALKQRVERFTSLRRVARPPLPRERDELPWVGVVGWHRLTTAGALPSFEQRAGRMRLGLDHAS
jgi:hypothetical protein